MESMINKEIRILKEQAEKLNASDFDLESWKTYTLILLERIFGKGSNKLQMIESLRSDFSSWSLRDATGSRTSHDPVRKKAGEILEAAMAELELFGSEMHIQSGQADDLVQQIAGVIEEELKGSQLKELKAIIHADDQEADKKSRLIGKLKEYGINLSPEIVAGILLLPSISKRL
jgi:hypothetical protein